MNHKKILYRVALCFTGAMLLLFAILYFLGWLHPSAFYPSRVRLKNISGIDHKETIEEIIAGEWRIELPNPNFLGPDAIEGWQDSRLVFYQNGECDLVSPTEQMMLERTQYLTSQELIERKNCVGKTLQGHYRMHVRDTSVYFEIDCPPYYRGMRVMEDPRADRYDRFRILAICGEPGCRCGVLWRKCHDVPILASRDTISGENSETEQVDTKESIDDLNEK